MRIQEQYVEGRMYVLDGLYAAESFHLLVMEHVVHAKDKVAELARYLLKASICRLITITYHY